MSSDEQRKNVIRVVLQAYTPDECLQAEKLLHQWLRDNPDDETMYDLVSTLATVKAAALDEAKQPAQKAAA